jgi:hypothetical protein
MTLVEEEIPMMALAEDGDERQVYAYQARTWMWATLLPGVALLGLATWLHLAFAEAELLITLPLFVFGLLMLYSTWYSLTADQWLMFDGEHKLVRFHKSNIYGRIDWELPATDFTSIQVLTLQDEKHWVLKLNGTPKQRLLFGDSAFAKMSHTRALTLAEKAGRLTGIGVKSAN